MQQLYCLMIKPKAAYFSLVNYSNENKSFFGHFMNEHE